MSLEWINKKLAHSRTTDGNNKRWLYGLLLHTIFPEKSVQILYAEQYSSAVETSENQAEANLNMLCTRELLVIQTTYDIFLNYYLFRQFGVWGFCF